MDSFRQPRDCYPTAIANDHPLPLPHGAAFVMPRVASRELRYLWLQGIGLGVLLCAVGLVTSCNSNQPPAATARNPGNVPPNDPSLTLPPTPSSVLPTAKPVVLTMTLDSPVDLKVQEGDYVQKGQVISDRQISRLALEQQRKAIQQRLSTLSAGSPVKPEAINTEASALISKAQTQLEKAKQALAAYDAESPYTDYARQTLPLVEDQVRRSQLQANVATAEQNLARVIAKRDAALNQIQANREQQAGEQAELQAQLQTIEAKLAQLKPLLSQHDGLITAVQWPKDVVQGKPAEIQVTLQPGAPPANTGGADLPGIADPAIPGLPPIPDLPSGVQPPIPGNIPTLPQDGSLPGTLPTPNTSAPVLPPP